MLRVPLLAGECLSWCWTQTVAVETVISACPMNSGDIHFVAHSFVCVCVCACVCLFVCVMGLVCFPSAVINIRLCSPSLTVAPLGRVVPWYPA